MERCFIIAENAKLYKQFYDYIEAVERNNVLIKAFVTENHITTAKNYLYKASSNSFGIVLTALEYELFKKQLRKNGEWTKDGTLYSFKQTSEIGKMYKELGIKTAFRPNPAFELNECLFYSRSRLFEYNGVLYATIESEELTPKTAILPGWEEISKSQFYAIVDEIEKNKESSYGK